MPSRPEELLIPECPVPIRGQRGAARPPAVASLSAQSEGSEGPPQPCVDADSALGSCPGIRSAPSHDGNSIGTRRHDGP